MGSVKIKMSSRDKAKFNKDLKAFGKEFGFTTEQSLDALSQEFILKSKQLVAVDTGRLRASISETAKGRLFREVGTNVGYGLHIEFGTRFQKAQPFLRPALEDIRKRFHKVLEKKFKKQ